MKVNVPVIASDPAFGGRARQSHLQLKDHPSTALRVTVDEIAAASAKGGRLAMTAPRVGGPSFTVGTIEPSLNGGAPVCEPQGHNFANREIRTQRNRPMRCGGRVFRLGHKSITPYPYPRDLKITRAQQTEKSIGME